MNPTEIIPKLRQAEQATMNLKACTDKRKRDAAIDGLMLYIRSIREEIEQAP